MRIACLHLPQFPLQVALRTGPDRRGQALAVVGPGARSTGAGRSIGTPVIIACSRAARALGVRLGMTATTARALGDDLELVSAWQPELADAMIDTSHAIAEALLAHSPTVDRGGDPRGSHHDAYAEVPVGQRGASYGGKLVAALAELGLVARVGIADDRFTAWAAATQASDDAPVVTVPRGSSAAFLAPLPLSLLAIPPEVQHVLGALGVHTLGEFAALPPPSVARAWDADYQALARGESGTYLDRYQPRSIGAAPRAPAPDVPAPQPAFRLTPLPPRLPARRPTRGKHRPRHQTPRAQVSLFGDGVSGSGGG